MMQPTIELILIRHGETGWNTERRLQGHTDIPLNQTGLEQAEALGAALQSEQLDAIISSDLQRTRQTAQAVADLQGMDVIIDPQWRERCFGGFEGLLHSEIESRYPDEYAAWQAREVDAPFPPGERMGETMRQFHERISQSVRNLTRQDELSQLSHLHRHLRAQAPLKIAVVAHGGVLECIYRMANNLPLDAAKQVGMLNASINRLTITGDQIHLVSWGDIAHLEDALDEL